jgi:hypothetical protein
MKKNEYLKENGWYAFYTPNHWYRKEDYPPIYDNNLKLIPPLKEEGITLEEAYERQKRKAN